VEQHAAQACFADGGRRVQAIADVANRRGAQTNGGAGGLYGRFTPRFVTGLDDGFHETPSPGDQAGAARNRVGQRGQLQVAVRVDEAGDQHALCLLLGRVGERGADVGARTDAPDRAVVVQRQRPVTDRRPIDRDHPARADHPHACLRPPPGVRTACCAVAA
jgi:hypothetical protein